MKAFGLNCDQLVPTEAYKLNPKTGTRTRIILTSDDGIRPGTTQGALGNINSAFSQWGDASQITNGGAAVLLMTRRNAEELGLKILAKHVTPP